MFSAAAGSGGSAPLVFRNHAHVPSVHDEGWQAGLAEVVRAQGINAIYPTHDDALAALAADGYEPPAPVVGSPPVTAQIARSKRRTYDVLAGAVPMARLIQEGAVDPVFPLFARPDRGQGSEGAMRVDNFDDLAYARRHGSGLVTEFLPGRECTVDCFSDRAQGLIYVLARSRDRVRNGISVASEPVADQDQFRELARLISEQLEFWGAWFFQTREDAHGVPHVLEVAPRIAGTMSVSRLRGVNLPLLSLYEMDRQPIVIRELPVSVRVDRALRERVRDPITPRIAYVDLDDTLVVRGHVNTELVAVLVEIRGRGARLEVVTRHEGDPIARLEQLGLLGIFDAVHHLRCGEPKSSVVADGPNLLIDDSFSERVEVADASGALAIDCSMLALLSDDRS